MTKRKSFVLLALALLFAGALSAAPVRNMPVVRVQPNGDTLRCFVSGDEFFHRLHDRLGYTIVLNPETGGYVYADKRDGDLVPTAYQPGRDDPAAAGLVPGLRPDPEVLKKMHDAWEVPEQYRKPDAKTSGTNHGTLNNIVIFIRFSGEAASVYGSINNIRSMFNDSTAGAVSMYNYFKRTSYNKLHVPTHFFPAPSGNTIVSYQDSMPRSYYQPYSATNTNGYQTSSERSNREFDLLQRAVNWVNANSPVPTSLNIDMDNDNYVDNICFVVSGTTDGWNDLLWPHKWDLYSRYVYINGKRVYTFNFQLAGSGSHYFGVSTLCHEMTHTLGCPDLYHYYNYEDVSAAGYWDLMHSNSTPPQQTNSMFKKKYLNWFDSIPLLTDSGTYTMQSLATGPNRAYKIASPNSHQWYILEYRNSTDTFDSSIPNRGMLIWRYNDLNTADNADFDNGSTPHELWLFRPGSSDDTTNGTVSAAAFGVNGRTSFNSASNPHPYLCNGTADTSFSITNIVVSADYRSVSFTFVPRNGGGRSCPPLTTFPHTQGFEDGGDMGCWTFASMDGANDGLVGVYDNTYGTPHSGTYQFRFSSYDRASNYNQYLISPRLQAAGSLHFKFYYRKSNSSTESFSVKYSTTDSLPASFTHTLGSYSSNITTTWQLCDLLVPQNARFVAINYNSNYAYYVYIDDLLLRDTLSAVHDTLYVYDTITSIVHDTVTTIVYDSITTIVRDTVWNYYVDSVGITVFDTQLVELQYANLEVFATRQQGKVSGNGRYPMGVPVEIAALPNRGYVFDHWQDGNTENPRRVTLTANMVYVAYFEEAAGMKSPQPTVTRDTVVIHDTVWNYVHDTTWIERHDTVWNYVHDTTWFEHHDTVWYYVRQPYYDDTNTYFTVTVVSEDGEMGFAAGNGRFPIGTEVEIGAGALPGYRFAEWSDQSAENPRKVRLTEDVRLTARFVVAGEAVDTPEAAAAKVYAKGARVVVEVPNAGDLVEVYNVMGQRVFFAHGSCTTTPLCPGLYLVRTSAGTAQKVVVAQH